MAAVVGGAVDETVNVVGPTRAHGATPWRTRRSPGSTSLGPSSASTPRGNRRPGGFPPRRVPPRSASLASNLSLTRRLTRRWGCMPSASESEARLLADRGRPARHMATSSYDQRPLPGHRGYRTTEPRGHLRAYRLAPAVGQPFRLLWRRRGHPRRRGPPGGGRPAGPNPRRDRQLDRELHRDGGEPPVAESTKRTNSGNPAAPRVISSVGMEGNSPSPLRADRRRDRWRWL